MRRTALLLAAAALLASRSDAQQRSSSTPENLPGMSQPSGGPPPGYQPPGFPPTGFQQSTGTLPGTLPLPGGLPPLAPLSLPKTSTTTLQNVRQSSASISGIVLTPTAYRGTGRYSDVGLNLDFHGAYYIGRLYGKNTLDWTTDKANYIDRVGQWFFTVDGKMQVQREGDWAPALAFGAEGAYAFRDAPQPSVGSPGGTVKVTAATTVGLGGVYVVASKRLTKYLIVSAGHLEGDLAGQMYLLSEFLSPQAFINAGHIGQAPGAHSQLFGGFLWTRHADSPFGIEFMKPNGAPLNPLLINVRLGHLRFATFELAYLDFQGGYDLLGTITFRFTQYPR